MKFLEARSYAVYVWLLTASVASVGCATRTGRTHERPAMPAQEQVAATNQVSLIYTNVPRQQFTTWEKFKPSFWFGNADDPEPPAEYRPDDPGRRRRWYWRNGCHNFTFYIMGIADKKFTRVGRRPDKVFYPAGGWNWAVCRHKWLRLPFVSYQRGSFKFYVGWRERGNFGMKLNF